MSNYTCPGCSKLIDTNQPAPAAGEISICANCGEICEFNSDQELVKMNADRKEKLRADRPKAFQNILQVSAYFRDLYIRRRQHQPQPFLPHTFSKN